MLTNQKSGFILYVLCGESLFQRQPCFGTGLHEALIQPIFVQIGMCEGEKSNARVTGYAAVISSNKK